MNPEEEVGKQGLTLTSVSYLTFQDEAKKDKMIQSVLAPSTLKCETGEEVGQCSFTLTLVSSLNFQVKAEKGQQKDGLPTHSTFKCDTKKGVCEESMQRKEEEVSQHLV